MINPFSPRLMVACLALATGIGASAANEPALRASVVGDMEKPTGAETVSSSPLYLRDGTITLRGAGNEVVAFQVVLRADATVDGLDARLTDLDAPVNSTNAAPSAPKPRAEFFLEHYAVPNDASYGWGPNGGAGALPWRGVAWPDALVPFVDPYDPARPAVATPFAIDPKRHPNQGVWIDVLIPKGTAPGIWRGRLEVLTHGKTVLAFPVALTVDPFALPDATHVDAYGELYRETGVMFDSGVKFKLKPEWDWTVYRRYLQMAHAHRFLATERQGEGPLPRTPDGQPAASLDKPWSDDWRLFSPYVGQILNGSLFTPAQDYAGPCVGAPPSFFPAPFPQAFDGGALTKHLEANGGAMDPKLLALVEANARAFWREVQARGWTGTRWFAYVFDETDGAQDANAANGKIGGPASLHDAMRAFQEALDRGAGGPRVSLVWTSHADPARWSGTPADLAPFLRWWIPNGHAVNTALFKRLALAHPGQTFWFYHSGQPAIGNHSVNQLGIDLRLWGLLCRRYGMNGSFWWSMESFPKTWTSPDFNPYDHPNYRWGETRWGNGVLFYPGSRLTMIGARRNIRGPIPSLRMKAYRRGLQDYEYCWLADQAGRSAKVDALLKTLIPAAFDDATRAAGGRAVPGSWSHAPADYDLLRDRLAGLIPPRR